MERQEPLLPLTDRMKNACQIYCGECIRKKPLDDWHVMASVEPPHLGGPEPGNPYKPLVRDEDGSPNLGNLTPSELLLVDGDFSQWEVSIRQHVLRGRRLNEDKERSWYADQFGGIDSSEIDEQTEIQFRYQHTDKSVSRVAYRILVPDAKHMVEITCPHCNFHKRVGVRVVERRLYEVLSSGGHMIFGSRGLCVRGGRETRLHENR